MMTIVLKDVITSVDVMRDLASRPLRARVAFQTARLLKEIERAYGDYEEQRRNLVELFAKKDEHGELIVDENGNCQLYPDKIEEFNNQYNELINSSIEVNCEPIDIDSLGDIEFTPTQMAKLEPFMA